MMDRAEHLAWCKERALEYLKEGDTTNALASFMSDMDKHPETKGMNLFLAQLGMMEALARNVVGMRRWIEGFN